MLARIEEIDGVAWAGAEATGRFLAVRPRADADAEQLGAAIERALAGRGRRAGEALAGAQLAAREQGDPWYSAREVRALSFIEGRLVAVHVAAKVGGDLGLADADRAALAEAVREVFFAVLERVHAEGGRESSGWFYVEWPGIAAEAARRMEAQGHVLPALSERIAACYARG